MPRLTESVGQHQLIGVDTPLFIYHFEARSEIASVASEIVEALEVGTLKGVASTLVLAELLVRPFQLRNSAVVAGYRATLEHLQGLHLAAVDSPIATRAAAVRATYGIRVADAVHIATSLEHSATAFLTNDRRLRRIQDLDVLILEDFLDPA